MFALWLGRVFFLTQIIDIICSRMNYSIKYNQIKCEKVH